MRYTGRKISFFVSLLLLLFFLQGFLSLVQKSPTFDEPVHLTAGYLYWKMFKFDYNIIHPPLANMLNAIPLLFYKNLTPPPLQYKNEWKVAEEFLYKNRIDAERIFNQSRIITLIGGILLGWFIFRWSSELFGPRGGIISLVLFSFSPNILAHSRLITTDLMVTLFIFLTLYLLWKFINHPSLGSALRLGISLGLALATKYSSLSLLLLFFLLIPLIGKNKKGEVLWSLIMVLIIAFFILSLTYGLSGLPNYFQGIKVLLNKSKQGTISFFHGKYSPGGWWFYFPFLFIVKTPLTLLFLFSLSFFLLTKEKKKDLFLPPIVIGVYLLIAILSRIQIGARHILPIYPFLFLTCGILGKRGFPIKLGKLALVLLLLHPLNAILIYPHYLAYFNGILLPSRAYKWVADSNIDWGQDLKGLKKWMGKENVSSLYLSYFGTANPSYYGISYRYLPSSTANLNRYRYNPIPEKREILAISVSAYNGILFQDVYFYKWLHSYKPFSSIGYSILLFDITQDPYAHLNLGVNYYRTGLFREAREEFEKVLEIDPKNPVAWFNLGMVYETLGDTEEARKYFEKALKLAPPSDRKRIEKHLNKIRK